jgi:4-amino-4-deoxy-L-arabinose transferase-like glycosyltransferase
VLYDLLRRLKSRVPPHERSAGEQDQPLLVLLFLVGATLARLPNFNRSLWYDEVFYTSVFLRSQPLKVLFGDVHPPLYALLLLGWTGLFGDGEIAVRLPALLFGLASLVTTFALARSWFGHRVAFLALALMTLSPAHIWYSQENKLNMLLLLLTVCAIYWLYRAWLTDRPFYWWLFIAASILALWTDAYALWVVFAAFLWLWLQVLRQSGRSRLKWAVRASIVVLLAYIPLVLSALGRWQSLSRSYLRPFTLGEVYRLLLIYLSHGNTVRTVSAYAPFRELAEQPWPYFLVDGFFALLLLRGLWVVGRGWRARREDQGGGFRPDPPAAELLLFYFLTPLVCVLLASLVYPRIYIERSMLILLPPFMIALAAGVMAGQRSKQSYALLALLMLLNGYALFNLWVAKSDAWTVYKQNPDWRSASQYFKSEMAKTDGLLVVLAATPATELVYYDSRAAELGYPSPWREPARLFILHADMDTEVLYKMLLRENLESIYVVHNHYWDDGFKQLWERVAKDTAFKLVSSVSFKGLEIFKFRVLRNTESG